MQILKETWNDQENFIEINGKNNIINNCIRITTSDYDTLLQSTENFLHVYKISYICERTWKKEFAPLVHYMFLLRYNFLFHEWKPNKCEMAVQHCEIIESKTVNIAWRIVELRSGEKKMRGISNGYVCACHKLQIGKCNFSWR